jgi:hypothetical protein
MRRLVIGLLWLAVGAAAAQSGVEPSEVERFTDGAAAAVCAMAAAHAFMPHIQNLTKKEDIAAGRATPPTSSASGIGSRAPAQTRAESSTARGWSTPRDASPKLVLAAAAVLLSLWTATTVGATSPEVRSGQAGPVVAKFRGCTSAGWCRFWIPSADPLERGPLRVYPDGVPRTFSDKVAATAARDRMNALLAGMIHQHKRIVLYGLREVGGGAYAARVTVNDADLASDPVLLEMHGPHRGGIP